MCSPGREPGDRGSSLIYSRATEAQPKERASSIYQLTKLRNHQIASFEFTSVDCLDDFLDKRLGVCTTILREPSTRPADLSVSVQWLHFTIR